MLSACDAVRRITTKRRACARLFPLPIKHQTSYVKYGPYSPLDFVDTLLKGLPHLVALGPLYFISSILFFAGRDHAK
jgi:hypothetical protein